MIHRRQFATQLGALAATVGLPLSGMAQPSGQPELSRIIVGFPPGGSTDNVARRLAEKLRGPLRTNLIIDNKPGAGMQISVSTLKDAPADGSAMLLSPPSPLTIYPFTYSKLPYAATDVTPVCAVCAFPFAFAVGSAVPASVKTLADFVAWAKANPGKANFGSPASGSTPHLVGSLFGQMAGVALTHIGYRGDAPGLQDLMGGQISGYSTTLGSFLPHIASGRLRLLAITGSERSRFVPDLATYKEQGYALEMSEWFGLFVPARTPAPVVQRIADATRIAVTDPDYARALGEFGMVAYTNTPAELAAKLRAETDFWRENIKRLGFTADT